MPASLNLAVSRVLALDAALDRCIAGLVCDDKIVSHLCREAPRGQAALLAVLAAEALEQGQLAAEGLDLISVTVGPGSFTGIRAALALAHGIALGASLEVVGVTVGEAIAAASRGLEDGRILWVASDSKRGHVFLERGEVIESLALAALPAAASPVAVAGNAAVATTAALAARGFDAIRLDVSFPEPLGIARAGLRRATGLLPPRAAQPVYVDPPEVRIPNGAPAAPIP